MGNACVSPRVRQRPTPQLAHAPAGQKPACVKKLLVDEHDPNTLYAGSWDALVRRFDLVTGELTMVYAGCMADVIDLAQCTTPEGERLLFAAPCGPPGVCCWRRGDGQLLSVFAADAALASPHGAFSAYGLAATPTALYCGHAFKGVMSWPVTRAAVRDDGQAAIVSNPKLFGATGPLRTERGAAALVSSNGAMALALSPAGAPGPRLLVTGHIVELSVLLALPGSRAAVAPASSLSEAADANARQHAGDFGLFVWDAEAAQARACLGFRHHAALRAAEFCGPASIVSGDLNGLVLQWSLTGAVLRQFPPSQARCRVLLIASAGALPWPTGRREQRAGAPLVLSGSDEGPPLVAHELLEPSADGAAEGEADGPAEAEEAEAAEEAEPAAVGRRLARRAARLSAAPAALAAASAPDTPTGQAALRLLPGAAALPAGAQNSLYSVAQTPDLFLTGHKSGEIFAWSRESGNLVMAMGAACPVPDTLFARADLTQQSAGCLAVVMPGGTEGSHLAREMDVYVSPHYSMPYAKY